MTEKQKAAVIRILEAGNVSMTAADAAEILESAPQMVRAACKAGVQGFPCSVIGTRVKIPVLPFMDYWGIPVTPEQRLKLLFATGREYADAVRETRG